MLFYDNHDHDVNDDAISSTDFIAGMIIVVIAGMLTIVILSTVMTNLLHGAGSEPNNTS